MAMQNVNAINGGGRKSRPIYDGESRRFWSSSNDRVGQDGRKAERMGQSYSRQYMGLAGGVGGLARSADRGQVGGWKWRNHEPVNRVNRSACQPVERFNDERSRMWA
jgi:hypothetical protein